MSPDDAGIAVASRFGLSVTEPVALSDSNNGVLWLWPAPVVAKMATGRHRQRALELAVAKHLLTQGAPVVALAGELPQDVHHVEETELTFWTYQAPSAHEPHPRHIGGACSTCTRRCSATLLRCHRKKTNCRPSPRSWATAAGSQPCQRPTAFCCGRPSTSFSEMRRRAIEQRPLHGSPHGGNTLMVDGSVRFSTSRPPVRACRSRRWRRSPRTRGRSSRREPQGDVTVVVPVEQRSRLVRGIGDETVERHGQVGYYGCHEFVPPVIDAVSCGRHCGCRFVDRLVSGRSEVQQLTGGTRTKRMPVRRWRGLAASPRAVHCRLQVQRASLADVGSSADRSSSPMSFTRKRRQRCDDVAHRARERHHPWPGVGISAGVAHASDGVTVSLSGRT
jgi:hypothetical protein